MVRRTDVRLKQFRNEREEWTSGTVYPFIVRNGVVVASLYEVIDGRCRAYLDFEYMVEEERGCVSLYNRLKSSIEEKLPELGKPVFFFSCRKAAPVNRYKSKTTATAGKGDLKCSFHVHWPDGPVFESGMQVWRRAVSKLDMPGVDKSVYKAAGKKQLWRLPYFGKEDIKNRNVIEENSPQKEVADDELLTHDRPQQPYSRYIVSTDEETNITDEPLPEFQAIDDLSAFLATHTFFNEEEVAGFIDDQVKRFVAQTVNGQWVVIYKDKYRVTGTMPTLRFRHDKGYQTLSAQCFLVHSQIVFDPAEKSGDNCFNLWSGWGIPASANASATEPSTELLEHLDEFLSPEVAAWFLQWLGRIFTQPWKKTKVAVVLYSAKQQTGKGFLVDFLMNHIFRRYAIADSGIQWATNKFNSDLMAKLFVCCDEVSSVTSDDWHGRYDRLKGMITQTRLQVEPKGKERFEVADHSNYVFCTNHANAVKIEDGDARYMVIGVSEKHAKDSGYYAQLAAACCNDDYAARFFKHCVANADPEYDLVNNRPATQAGHDMWLGTTSSVSRFLYQVEHEDYQRDHRWKDNGAWWEIAPDDVWTAYLDWCERWKETPVKRQTFLTDIKKKGIMQHRTGKGRDRVYLFENEDFAGVRPPWSKFWLTVPDDP